jgi:arylsulfatase A-like enzyme
MAGLLSDNGYVTGMAGKWHIGSFPESVELPAFGDGDQPQDPAVELKLRKYQELSIEQVKKDAGFDFASSVLWGNFDGFPLKRIRYHNIPWITKGAIGFLDEQGKGDSPFFLYVATTAVHGPHHADSYMEDQRFTPGGRFDDVLDYKAPSAQMEALLEGVNHVDQHRTSGIASLDHHIDLLIRKLDELKVLDNTIVVFLADHNIEPGKATCYEKGTKIPMIIRWPGKGNGVVQGRVQAVDLLPTLLEAAGMSLPEGSQSDGVGFEDLLFGEKTEVRDYIYYEAGYTRGISDGRYKYIAFRPPEEAIREMEAGLTEFAPNHLNVFKQGHSQIALVSYPGYFDPDQLYDLAEDPFELKNLAHDPQFSEVLVELRDQLALQLNTFDHPFDLETPAFMTTHRYREMAEKTRSMGTDFIPWLSRDHGAIPWPPD